MLKRFAAQNVSPRVQPDRLQQRVWFVVCLLALWMLVIGGRLVYLQSAQYERLRGTARAQQTGEEATKPPRGLILDRHGRELARSIDVPSYFADPALITDIKQTATRLAPVLGMDADDLSARLVKAKTEKRRFIWLRRKLAPETKEQVVRLKLEGIGVRGESQRIYPNGRLGAHVVGFMGLDEKGLGGIEQVQNASLTGDAGRLFVETDARRKAYESREVEAQDGNSVVLTIDAAIQYRTEQALAATVANTHARSGAVVVLDPHSGEILALANAPTFDPNRAAEEPPEARTNDALQNIYEPGSTFKVVAYSGAIEEGLARPEDTIDCLGGSINVFGRIVHDHSSYSTLTLTEALAKSSNVAAIKLGMRLGDGRMYEYIRRFGFGSRTGIDLPGETPGLLRPVERWQKSSIGSIAIGQEIGTTPVQMAQAFGVIANDGVRVQPHIVRQVVDEDGNTIRQTQPKQTRAIKAETARTLRGMLEMVTLKGTAKRAQIDGYTAAGKTGTAQKIDPKTRAYSATKYVASFVGFAPIDNPAVVIVAVVDEPIGAYHGGDVAAPLFRDIAETILPYLNVMPDGTFKDAPEVHTPRDDARSGDRNLASNETLRRAIQVGDRDVDRGDDAALSASLEAQAADDADESTGMSVSDVVYAIASDKALMMPNLSGKSVRDAWQVCARLGLQLEARGDGRARRQTPAAGSSVEAGQTVQVEFKSSDGSGSDISSSGSDHINGGKRGDGL